MNVAFCNANHPLHTTHVFGSSLWHVNGCTLNINDFATSMEIQKEKVEVGMYLNAFWNCMLAHWWLCTQPWCLSQQWRWCQSRIILLYLQYGRDALYQGPYSLHDNHAVDTMTWWGTASRDMQLYLQNKKIEWKGFPSCGDPSLSHWLNGL